MQNHPVLDFLEEVTLVKPTDLVLRQIQNLISQGLLRPGDALPSERDLAEKLTVGRGYVRDALKKLEFYGVIEARPNRKPIVAALGIRTLDSQITNMLRFTESDLKSIMETRVVLEVQAACLAAERATPEECAGLFAVLEEHAAAFKDDTPTIEIDFLFHSRVAQCSHNLVLLSLITKVIPPLFQKSREFDVCGGLRRESSLREHEAVAKAIRDHEPDAARTAMEHHMRLTCNVFQARMF